MNYSTIDKPPSEASDGPEEAEQARDDTIPDSATFPGDTGRIPHETRRVLVQLLLGPAVDGRRQSNLWSVLLRDETIIRERLHELFLELVIDYDQKVAFTRQVAADDTDIPILLRRAHLTFLESVLILFLRQRLTQADTQGDRAVVSLMEMSEHLSVYERTGNVDHARFDKQCQSAIDKAKKLSLLQKIRGADDRFEVSPTLKLLFPAEEIQALSRTYQESLHDNRVEDPSEPPVTTDDGEFQGSNDE